MTRRKFAHRVIFLRGGRIVRVTEIRRVPLFVLPWEVVGSSIWSSAHLALFARAA